MPSNGSLRQPTGWKQLPARLAAEVDDCRGSKLHRALQESKMNPPNATDPDRQRHTFGDMHHRRILVEMRQQRP